MRLRDVVCEDPGLEDFRRKLLSLYDSRPCFMRDESLCEEADRRICPINRAPDCPRIMSRASGVERERIRASREQAELGDAKRCRIPERLYGLLGVAGIELIRDTDAVVQVRNHYKGVLVLMGPTGTGKTVAAAHWAWRRRAVFWRAEELATSVNWFDRREAEAVSDAPALVVDDLGTEYGDQKGNWRSKLDALFNRRYDSRAPTIITTNLAMDELRLLVGERVWRRIKEDGILFRCIPTGQVSVPPPAPRGNLSMDDDPFIG